MKSKTGMITGFVVTLVTSIAIGQPVDPLPSDVTRLNILILQRDELIKRKEVELAKCQVLNGGRKADIAALTNELTKVQSANRKMGQELRARDIAKATAVAKQQSIANMQDELGRANGRIGELENEIRQRDLLNAGRPNRAAHEE